MTLITKVRQFDNAAISEAAALIRDGQPVAVATETVYGIAADATNATAVARIYAAKGRPAFNPLIIHVPDLATAEILGAFTSEARALAALHWPGPLTLVVPAHSANGVAALATSGLSTIALRVPAHRAIRALLASAGVPLAAPSANLSGRISPTTAAHVMQSLAGRIALVIDDGPSPNGLESTIIAATGGPLRLLRPGPVFVPGAIVEPASHIEAPGQSEGHYAPVKPLRLSASARNGDEWLIGFGAVEGDSTLSPTGDLIEAAARLFACLHEGDASPARSIAVAPIPTSGLGLAINDRLMRASQSA